MELNIDNQKTKQNIFLFPTILCVIQFVFVFVVLFKSGLSFAPVALAVDAVLMLMWCGLFVQRHIRNKIYVPSLKGLVLFICFVIASFIIIRKSWFQNYLNIDCMNRFFNGETFIDPLYHSAIAESYITNGYSSIQMNAPTFIAYHSLSHLMIAGVSKLFDIPCFVTYNYIYPLIAMPLFVYLFQKIILIVKEFLRKDKVLYFYDFVFIVLFMIWENHIMNYSAGLYFDIWAHGESYCVSLVLLFVYFCIINVGYKKIKCFEIINLTLLIPVFILLLSFCKVSTGCMFFFGMSYYIFRKNLFKNKKWLFAFLYLFIFAVYYFVPGKFSPAPTYPSPENTTSSFELFHYVRHYAKNILFAVVHYILCFSPVMLVLFFERPKKLFSLKIRNIENKNVIVEMLILSLLVSCLPGIVMKIDGGSALYFVAPVWTMAFILLFAMELPKSIKVRLPKLEFRIPFKSKDSKKINIFIVFFSVLCLGVFAIGIRDADIYDMLRSTAHSRDITKAGLFKDGKVFLPSPVIQNTDYKLFSQIRELTKRHKKDYCIFLRDDSNIILKYDRIWGYEGTFLINPYLATSAYTGLTIINAVYNVGNRFYRGDGFGFGQYSDFTGYSLPPAICGKKVTLENMKDVAQKLGKKYIIVLGKDDFEMIGVD